MLPELVLECLKHVMASDEDVHTFWSLSLVSSVWRQAALQAFKRLLSWRVEPRVHVGIMEKCEKDTPLNFRYNENGADYQAKALVVRGSTHHRPRHNNSSYLMLS